VTSRVRDFVVYIGVAVLFVATAYAYAVWVGGNVEPIAKWGGLIGTSLILFGYAIRDVRMRNKPASFWVVLFLLLGVHLGLWSIVLLRVQQWRAMTFVLLFPIEYPLIYSTLKAAGRHRVSR
jgi:hypothetical protein